MWTSNNWCLTLDILDIFNVNFKEIIFNFRHLWFLNSGLNIWCLKIKKCSRKCLSFRHIWASDKYADTVKMGKRRIARTIKCVASPWNNQLLTGRGHERSMLHQGFDGTFEEIRERYPIIDEIHWQKSFRPIRWDFVFFCCIYRVHSSHAVIFDLRWDAVIFTYLGECQPVELVNHWRFGFTCRISLIHTICWYCVPYVPDQLIHTILVALISLCWENWLDGS